MAAEADRQFVMYGGDITRRRPVSRPPIRPGWLGLGVITIDFDVTDPDALVMFIGGDLAAGLAREAGAPSWAPPLSAAVSSTSA